MRTITKFYHCPTNLISFGWRFKKFADAASVTIAYAVCHKNDRFNKSVAEQIINERLDNYSALSKDNDAIHILLKDSFFIYYKDYKFELFCKYISVAMKDIINTFGAFQINFCTLPSFVVRHIRNAILLSRHFYFNKYIKIHKNNEVEISDRPITFLQKLLNF